MIEAPSLITGEKKIVINKGHNLIIDGIPDKNIINIKDSSTILIHPSSIKNIKVKLLVKKLMRIALCFRT